MHLLSSLNPLLLSGFFIGLLVGQTGMGGGALMTPILLLFGVHHPPGGCSTNSATKTRCAFANGHGQLADGRLRYAACPSPRWW